MKDCVVLRGYRDQMVLLCSSMTTRESKKPKVAALSSSRGEDQLVRLSAKNRGNAVSGIINDCTGASSRRMDARGISKKVTQ
jgi:hypothetical protein